MNNKIETSTSALGNLIYHGTYETLLGEYMGNVTYEQRDEVTDVIGKLAVDVIAEAFGDAFPNDLSDDFELTYKRTYSPRYYNFETDSVIFDFEYSDGLRAWLYGYANGNSSDFKKFLADNYTSYDGFISYTPNNWGDWVDGWNDDDWRCVSALLLFIIKQELTDGDIEHYWYDFNEQATEIIEEKYTPWEYAERFDDGYIGVVRSEYDEDKQGTVYNAYLIDCNGSIVNTASICDEYDEDFHMSAFAVWEYSDIVTDLTKSYSLCSRESVHCDVPDFDIA